MASEGVGDRVRRYRRLRKLSQQRLADLAETDKGYISRVESGKIARPGLEVLRRITRALDVRLQDLAEPGWYEEDPTNVDWVVRMLADPTISDEWKRVLEEMTRRDRDLKARDDPPARPHRAARS